MVVPCQLIGACTPLLCTDRLLFLLFLLPPSSGPASSALLRTQYHRDGKPEADAADVWGTADVRIALHWRTGKWATNSRGAPPGGSKVVYDTVLDTVLGGRTRLNRIGDGGGGGGTPIRVTVALVTSMKEDKAAQDTVTAHIAAIKTRLADKAFQHDDVTITVTPLISVEENEANGGTGHGNLDMFLGHDVFGP